VTAAGEMYLIFPRDAKADVAVSVFRDRATDHDPPRRIDDLDNQVLVRKARTPRSNETHPGKQQTSGEQPLLGSRTFPHGPQRGRRQCSRYPSCSTYDIALACRFSDLCPRELAVTGQPEAVGALAKTTIKEVMGRQGRSPAAVSGSFHGIGHLPAAPAARYETTSRRALQPVRRSGTQTPLCRARRRLGPCRNRTARRKGRGRVTHERAPPAFPSG
jgi:hypothetical protein